MELVVGIGAAVGIALLIGVGWLKRRGDRALRALAAAQRESDDARRQWKELNERWESVTQNIGEGIVLIDRDARILFFNPAAANLLGLSFQIGQTFDDAAWQLQIQPLLQDVFAHRAESLVQTAVKEDRAFQVGVRAGPASSVLIVLSEMTELQRLGRARRDFVANISHELRTPVTSLQVLAETLANELPADSTLAIDLLEKLHSQVDALRQLTDEMMDLALIESGQAPIKLVETSALALVEHAVELLRPQAERKQIALDVRIGETLSVLADPDGIHKVLSNLVHNAIKHTPEHGWIKVSARPEADLIEFSIADSGIGIPARDLSRIFERFYKVDRARVKDGTRGTGLGLAIAKHMVEGHGGRIWAESVEGKGSTFHFTLPSARRAD
jgi:two-component system, OmpR family, phosphate regulon sensor histidine kinase PhoR